MEQSATVWHSSLTQENIQDLERVQEKYQGYLKGVALLGLETLESRRKHLCLNFTLKCVKNEKMKHMFPLNDKAHKMNTRTEEKYKVQHANTDRLKYSSIICKTSVKEFDSWTWCTKASKED